MSPGSIFRHIYTTLLKSKLFSVSTVATVVQTLKGPEAGAELHSNEITFIRVKMENMWGVNFYNHS